MTSFAPAAPEVRVLEAAVAEQEEAAEPEPAPVVAVAGAGSALVGPQSVRPAVLASAEEPACWWHGPRTLT